MKDLVKPAGGFELEKDIVEACRSSLEDIARSRYFCARRNQGVRQFAGVGQFAICNSAIQKPQKLGQECPLE